MSRFAVALVLMVALALLLPGSLMAQPPVMGVFGTANMGGDPAPQDTEVVAYIQGAVVARTKLSAGAYNMNILQPSGAYYQGQTVSFTVGGESAQESTVWRAGTNQPLNLTVPGVTLVSLALSSIFGKYTIVWWYNAQNQEWYNYDAAVPWLSGLRALKRGQGYWIKATEDTTVFYGGNLYPLSEGWNLIGWLG
jgi:hypothetical protein